MATGKWAEKEEELLLRLYFTHERREIAALLCRTLASVRKHCSVLGLNQKRPSWTENDIATLRAWYETADKNTVLDMPALSKLLGKSESAIGCKANELRLTMKGRPLPESAKRTIGTAMKASIAKKGHPRGALGLKHSEASRGKMSAAHKDWPSKLTEKQLKERMSRTVQTRIERYGTAGPTQLSSNAYSRTKSGKRADLGGRFFRSAWEANYARYLNFLLVNKQIMAWEYEPKTFVFEGVKRGPFTYTPDFLITENTGDKVWHEVKGWMDSKSKGKLKRFATKYPSEKLVLIDSNAYNAIAKAMSSALAGWE